MTVTDFVDGGLQLAPGAKVLVPRSSAMPTSASEASASPMVSTKPVGRNTLAPESFAVLLRTTGAPSTITAFAPEFTNTPPGPRAVLPEMIPVSRPAPCPMSRPALRKTS